MLTSSMLLYTPITSSRPKLEAALSSMRDVKKIRFGAVPGPRIKWERSIVRNARETISTEEGAANCLETVERSCFRTMGWQS